MRFQSIMEELGTPLPEFALPDPQGRIHTSEEFRAARGLLVAFLCNHCPFVQHILDRFVALTHEYAPRGIATVAISSNDVASHPEDGPAQMGELAREHRFGWPYLYDESQQVARQFHAACTPDFFLYGPERRLYYRGRFDSTRPTTIHTAGKPGAGLTPTGADLRAAFDWLLAGKPPPPDQQPSVGCSMKWKPGLEPEWN